VSTTTAGATIYCGTTNPPTTVCSSPVTVASSMTLYAMTGATGYSDSAVSSAQYTVGGTACGDGAIAASCACGGTNQTTGYCCGGAHQAQACACVAPTFSPAGGSYGSAQSVTVATTTSGSVVYCATLNPPPRTTPCSSPVSVPTSRTLYAVAVKANYEDGSSSAAYTIGTPPAPPATPGNVAASPLSSTGIQVSWNASANATGYKIQRAPDVSGAPGTWSSAITYSASPYSDNGLAAATSYWYRVAATNAAGTSAYSAAVSAITVAAASPMLGLAAPSAAIQLIGNRIYDTAGEPVVGRGPELVSAGSGIVSAIDTIASTGANAVRLLLTLDTVNGMSPTTFDSFLAEVAAKGMVAWISLFTWDGAHSNMIGSSLGGGNFYSLTAPVGTGTCNSATPAPCFLAMWSRQWLKDLMIKYQANVIVDAMQEFIGTADPSTDTGRQEWRDQAKVNLQFFRSAGYINPLEFMANYQGRDLYGIVEYGDSIRSMDTVLLDGNPQTMFGWQDYWGTADDWYAGWQGGLFLGSGGHLTGAQALHQYAVTQDFPIEFGFDNYGGDMNQTWQANIDQAASDSATWLWWSWQEGSAAVECPVDGSTCITYVEANASGFGGAQPIHTISSQPWTLPVNHARVLPQPGYESAVSGGMILGSNTSPTSGFVTLGTVSATPASGQWATVTFTNSTVYRYIMYQGPTGSFGRVAEVELYSGNVRLTGTGIGTTTTTGFPFANALDRNVTTYFLGSAADSQSVGLDLGN